MPKELVTTTLVQYRSRTEQRTVFHKQAVSPVEAVELARTLPESEIFEMKIDLSGKRPKIVSFEKW